MFGIGLGVFMLRIAIFSGRSPFYCLQMKAVFSLEDVAYLRYALEMGLCRWENLFSQRHRAISGIGTQSHILQCFLFYSLLFLFYCLYFVVFQTFGQKNWWDEIGTRFDRGFGVSLLRICLVVFMLRIANFSGHSPFYCLQAEGCFLIGGCGISQICAGNGFMSVGKLVFTAAQGHFRHRDLVPHPPMLFVPFFIVFVLLSFFCCVLDNILADESFLDIHTIINP